MSFASKGKQLKKRKASYPTQKKNHEIPPVQLRPGTNICLTTAEPFLTKIAWSCNDAYCSWSSQLVPSFLPGQSFLFICLSLAVWFCLKTCSENRVLVVLLQIGATDLTVRRPWMPLDGSAYMLYLHPEISYFFMKLSSTLQCLKKLFFVCLCLRYHGNAYFNSMANQVI